MSTAAPPTPQAVGTADDPGRLWWVAVLAGALSLVVGIASLAYPGPTLLAVGILFGAYLTVWGALLVVRGISGRDTPGAGRIVLIIIGVLGALTGLVLLVRPGESVLTVVWVLGFWWTVAGIMQFARGVAEHEGRWWNIAIGLLGVAVGVLILAQPGIGLVTLVWIVGIGLILQGVAEIGSAILVRRLHKEGLV